MTEPPFSTPYAGYDVLDKWDSPSWNDQTRSVVARRLHQVPRRRFLSQHEWMLLEAVAARILPQPDRSRPVPITPWIDEKLAEDKGPGFRYADMPPMRDAWRRGLAAIESEALARYGLGFAELRGDEQDSILADIQNERCDPHLWQGLPPAGFFLHLLLKEIVAAYYSHPAAWSEIGFGGPASPRGYVRLGFDERDPWEAEEEHA
jgi:hypothetical protein